MMHNKLLIILTVLFCTFTIGCTSSSQKATSVTAMETQGLLRNGFAVLVDVREEQEVQKGTAEKALWLPLSQMNKKDETWKNFISKLPKDKQIVVYCSNMKCGQEAASLIASAGFKTGYLESYEELIKSGIQTRKP